VYAPAISGIYDVKGIEKNLTMGNSPEILLTVQNAAYQRGGRTVVKNVTFTLAG
jgi:hypothetical protein